MIYRILLFFVLFLVAFFVISTLCFNFEMDDMLIIKGVIAGILSTFLFYIVLRFLFRKKTE